jgi:hypothetical protein
MDATRLGWQCGIPEVTADEQAEGKNVPSIIMPYDGYSGWYKAALNLASFRRKALRSLSKGRNLHQYGAAKRLETPAFAGITSRIDVAFRTCRAA